jgi:hypothetical protein
MSWMPSRLTLVPFENFPFTFCLCFCYDITIDFIIIVILSYCLFISTLLYGAKGELEKQRADLEAQLKAMQAEAQKERDLLAAEHLKRGIKFTYYCY